MDVEGYWVESGVKMSFIGLFYLGFGQERRVRVFLVFRF